MEIINPGPGKQIRVIFLDGSWLDMLPPPDPNFNFPMWIKVLRGDGFLLGDNLYVRMDLVKCILTWDESNPPLLHTAQNAPTTGIKQ